MKIDKVIPFFSLVMSVTCWDSKNYDLDSIRFPGEKFQMGAVPYQPVPVPLRTDVNGLQVKGGPDQIKEEIVTIKSPNIYLEPPLYSNKVVNRNTEAAVVNKAINTNDSVKIEPNRQILGALSSFGFNLIKDISTMKAGNSLISPYSVAILLSLLQQGALGNSQQQITKALQLSSQESAALFKSVSEDIKINVLCNIISNNEGFANDDTRIIFVRGRFQKRNSHSIVEIANNIFVANEFDLNKDFKTNAINNFGSDVTPLSFTNSDAASQTINKWVSDKTRNKITSLISPDAIGQNTQLVLLNAIYFKGSWKMKFNSNSTTPNKFHLRDGQTKMTPFMKSYHMYKWGYDPKLKADVIIVPFENDDYSMMILLPKGIDELEFTLSALPEVNLKDYHDKLTFQEINLEIPKFNIKEQVDLVPILKKIGVTDIFSWKSNLRGIGLHHNLAPRVDSAIHSAVLSIDEEGGTAAGATAFTVIALMYDDTPDIKVNRPFIAVFWDNKLSFPLFVARVEDPTL